MFDEFVTQPEDDMNHRNEIEEALEDRDREHEDEDDGSNGLDDFVNEAYDK